MSASLANQLLAVAGRYAELRGISLSTVSNHVFQDGKVLARVARGGDVGINAWDRAMQWFSDHWPIGSGRLWPKGVRRPPRTKH